MAFCCSTSKDRHASCRLSRSCLWSRIVTALPLVPGTFQRIRPANLRYPAGEVYRSYGRNGRDRRHLWNLGDGRYHRVSTKNVLSVHKLAEKLATRFPYPLVPVYPTSVFAAMREQVAASNETKVLSVPLEYFQSSFSCVRGDAKDDTECWWVATARMAKGQTGCCDARKKCPLVWRPSDRRVPEGRVLHPEYLPHDRFSLPIALP